MKKLWMTLFILILFCVNLCYASPVEETYQNSMFHMLDVIGKTTVRVVEPRNFHCELEGTAESFEQFQFQMYRDCQVHMSIRPTPLGDEYFFIEETGILHNPVSRVYTVTGGALYEVFEQFFPDWEVLGDAVSQVQIPKNSWKELSVRTLQENLSSEYSVFVDETQKSFSVFEKSTISSGDFQTNYAIFYEFNSLNQDLYELVKSYASQVRLVRHLRDDQIYLQIAKAAPSREELTKSYTYLKALLDDRATKAQRLGTYFLKNERQNLQLLYVLLSDAEILAFRPGELVEVSPEFLKPKGLIVEKEKLQTRLLTQPATSLGLPEALLNRTQSKNQPSRTNTQSSSRPTANSSPGDETATSASVKTQDSDDGQTTTTVNGKQVIIPKMR